jgi:hypothetical protein
MDIGTSASPIRKKTAPRWWQLALPVVLLGIAGYRMGKYRHFVETEGIIRDVKITTTQNRTVEGCVVAYQYRVQYTDHANRTYFREGEYSTESRTCRTDEIQSGNSESVYYNPANPAESIPSPMDAWSLGLVLFSVFGLLVAGITWLTHR